MPMQSINGRSGRRIANSIHRANLSHEVTILWKIAVYITKGGVIGEGERFEIQGYSFDADELVMFTLPISLLEQS